MKAYLPDDYIRSHQLTFAVDTFCFGIFMFELVCARYNTFLFLIIMLKKGIITVQFRGLARSPSHIPKDVNNPHRMNIRELMMSSQVREK